MSLNLDAASQAALELAKRAVSEGAELDAAGLMASLYHQTGVKERCPQLGRFLEPPQAQRPGAPAQVPVAEAVRPVLRKLAEIPEAVTPERFLAALLDTEAGRRHLISRGMGEKELLEAKEALSARSAAAVSPRAEAAPSAWRASAARKEVITALDSFGRMLTATDPPYKGVVEIERSLQALVHTLSQMGPRNAIITGHPGTGKSALVYEFARRLVQGDESIPPRLRDHDVFELSPTFLRSGASMVGQYDERVKSLIEILRAHRKVILFVDEIHSLLRSGLHEKGPFSEANEAFKGVLGSGEITCIGCTTRVDYRHYIQPDRALARRFTEIFLEPPSPEATVSILEARLPRLRQHYAPLLIPETILQPTVALTEDYLPSRYQPEKSIRLLDAACAYCVTEKPPKAEVTKDELWKALEKTIGHSIARSEGLTEDGVFAQLSGKIIGQDETLRRIARAFVAGLGGWTKSSGPRGVFFFCGPTGVGKTETALLLARILGGGREALVRVDCNALHGSSHDLEPLKNRLLGVPPGFLGYVRGQGGILSRVRDLPEGIILFDEIEKAAPGLAKLLLQMLDDGRLEDTDGDLLDFRRSFIIFTTNAGCQYDRKRIGFEDPARERPESPRVDVEALKSELRAIGYGEEFLARVGHFFDFRGLEREAVERIVAVQLAQLVGAAQKRGYRMSWDARIVNHLSSEWQPRFGIRHLTAILLNRISEQLSVAEAQGELKGVVEIRLQVMALDDAAKGRDLAGLTRHERDGETLIINLA